MKKMLELCLGVPQNIVYSLQIIYVVKGHDQTDCIHNIPAIINNSVKFQIIFALKLSEMLGFNNPDKNGTLQHFNTSF